MTWSWKIGQGGKLYSAFRGGIRDDERRRFTADFKARVAVEAPRRDKTVREIAARHKVHPNQVSTWKRQAVDGLSGVFSNGAEHTHRDHVGEVRDLRAKVGELTGVRDFLARGLKR